MFIYVKYICRLNAIALIEGVLSMTRTSVYVKIDAGENLHICTGVHYVYGFLHSKVHLTGSSESSPGGLRILITSFEKT